MAEDNVSKITLKPNSKLVSGGDCGKSEILESILSKKNLLGIDAMFSIRSLTLTHSYKLLRDHSIFTGGGDHLL